MKKELIFLMLGLGSTQLPSGDLIASEAIPNIEKPNIIFILIDDQRYDFLSFLDHPWIKTPHIDRLAEQSVFFENAFVTTSLCSPSRASILTGKYAHQHGAIDNDSPLSPEIPTFPQELQKSGYKTALVGKWHMGGSDPSPRPGFDLWLSFPGQGKFNDPELNLNGETLHLEGYTTDILTDYAVDFIEKNVKEKNPYCLYLSHKSVHEPFTPAKRHEGTYKDLIIPRPESFYNTPENTKGKPDWIVAQRDSWHGSGRPNLGDYDDFYRRYSECMLGVDESIGRVVSTLEKLGELENTVIIYFSDNGYLMGEHGLIDKRVMLEGSIRVPCFIYYPQLKLAPETRDEFILNIDLGPTILDIAGVPIPASMHGESFLPLLTNKSSEWRTNFLYEYFCDPYAVQTPTLFGLRTEKYSYCAPVGIWDKYELYDIQNDPDQMNNLLGDIEYGYIYGSFLFRLRRQNPELYEIVQSMESRIDEIMNETGGRRSPSYKK
jgi:arylsulfatase A-like enzyme